jgi:hypothetical protein
MKDTKIKRVLEVFCLRDFQLKKYPKISCGAGILPANHQGQAGCPSHKIG